MVQFLVQRGLSTIAVLFGVTLILFFVIRLAPGDPARLMLPDTAPEEAVQLLRERLGLDRPLPVQYARFLAGTLRGDFGTSYMYNAPVERVVWDGLKVTARLALLACLITLVVGVPLGALAAVKRQTFWENIALFIAVLGQAVPVFVLGLILILIFSVNLGWLPTSGSGAFRHLVLPAVTLSAYSLALLTRLTRSSLLDELGKDYVRTARSKGATGRRVIFRHAMRNTLMSVITVAGVQLGSMLGGTVVVETVFSYPGMGLLVINAVHGRDYPLLQYIVLVSSTIFVLINLVVDLLYAYIDPRVVHD